MLREPTEFEVQQLFHAVYDAKKAHEYYEKHKHLKGRKPGRAWDRLAREAGPDVPGAQTRAQIHQGAKARQKKELAALIQGLEQRLQKLEALIKQKEHAEASDNRKAKAKKERAAKEKDKPKTAAEKAEAARENKKYRDKHKQKLKGKDGKSGGGSSDKKQKSAKDMSVSELRTFATKVKGQIAVAKTKLAAL